jgi:hypothetical protein
LSVSKGLDGHSLCRPYDQIVDILFVTSVMPSLWARATGDATKGRVMCKCSCSRHAEGDGLYRMVKPSPDWLLSMSRVPGDGGSAVIVSKYDKTFSNITGMAFSIVPTSSGLLPEFNIILGAYEDGAQTGNHTNFTPCHTSIPLNILAPVNQSAWNVTFKSADATKIISNLVSSPPPKVSS